MDSASFTERVHPDYRQPLAEAGRRFERLGSEWDAQSAQERRRSLAEFAPEAPPLSAPALDIEERSVPDGHGGPGLGVRIARPRDRPARGAILFIHGGGMWLGSASEADPFIALLAERLDVVVVAVDYRLAPEHPYPAALQDCTSALLWMHGAADELGFDPEALCLYGPSAGGGLAIATALWNRDHQGPALRHVVAVYPMIDDTNSTPSARAITGLHPTVWDVEANAEAWQWYLGGRPADQYAAPTRADDLRGLPPMSIDVGDLDVFRDENILFATRLMQAGVPTSLHVFEGVFHGADGLAPDAAPSVDMLRVRLAALRRALGTTAQTERR